MSRNKSKSSTLDQVIGLAIIGGLAWAWWAIGGLGGVLDLVLGPLIGIAAVALLTQLWRAPAVKDTKAGATLFRMHDGGMRLLGHPRVAVPAVLVGALLLPPVAGAPVLAAALWLAGRAPKPEPEPESEPWYGARSMVDHLDRAGVLKAPAWLPYQPRLVRDDQYGTKVDLWLPGGMVADQVIARRDPLASSLGVAPARLTVKPPPDAPANVVRLFLRAPRNPAAPLVDGSGETSPIVGFQTFYWGNPLGVPNLHGGSGGDVGTLRLRSGSGGKLADVASITAEYGAISIKDTTITSWDPATGAADTDANIPSGGVRGRAFIRALSILEGNTPRPSTMDIVNSDLGYLGFFGAESYGVAYKAKGCGVDTPAVCDSLGVLGKQIGSKFHHNFMGTYTWGADGMEFSGNEYFSNISYGLDPHDDSDYLVIKNNKMYDNGNHGLICSQRCDHLTITDNEVTNNGHTPYVAPGDPDPSDNQVHGIMLHRGISDSVVKNNTVRGQITGAGIAIFDSVGNTVEGNTVSGNKIADGGDEVLQGSGEPVQGRHDEGVSGVHELQARRQLGAVGVAAGLFLGEDPPAPCGGERVDLPLEVLPVGGDPGVADLDLGECRGFGGEKVGGAVGGRSSRR